MIHSVVQWLIETVSALGYPGIVLLMFIESTFLPLPSELVMPPAGYLAAQVSASLWDGDRISEAVGLFAQFARVSVQV